MEKWPEYGEYLNSATSWFINIKYEEHSNRISA